MADERDPKEQEAVTTPIGVNTSCPQCGSAMPAFETRCSACGFQRSVTTAEQRDSLRERLQAGIGVAYELMDMIGKGGMGVVFRAKEKSLERDVALKVLAFDPLLVPEAFARFEREAKLAARLDHPHIVPIFAVGQGQGIAFYTMRLVRGGSLEELLARETKLPPARAVKYLREVALALDHAHSHGVVHRDVKPANIMLGDGDHVFVADFGIARAVEGTGGGLTSTGVVGSPAYMAPEQWQGGAIDGRADQYALGILSYELLTGRRPYRDATMHQLLRLHLTEDLPDITQDLGPAAGAVRDVLRRATAKDPKDRFASVTEFVNALDVALSGDVASAQSAATAISGKLPRRANDSPPAAIAGAATRRRTMAPLLAVVLIAAGGVAGYSFWNAQRTKTPVAPARPETVVVQNPARPETVRVKEAARPETVRVGDPNRATVSPPPATGGSAASAPSVQPIGPVGYVMVTHPFVVGGQIFIDGVNVGHKQPAVYAVSPGRHVVGYSAVVPTFPREATFRVPPNDTLRVMFLPLEGGGARGDSMRAHLRETMRRIELNGDGRGGRRNFPLRGGNRSGAGRRGDTLSTPGAVAK